MKGLEYYIVNGYLATLNDAVYNTRFVDETFDTLEDAKEFVAKRHWRFHLIRKCVVAYLVVEETEYE